MRLPGVFALAQAFLTVFLFPGLGTAATDPAITLPQAVAIAFQKNPDLAAFPLEIRGAEGRVLQASLRPNPEVEVELANFGGDLPGTRRSEATLGVTQPLELGGKRPARTRKAAAEVEVLRRDYESLSLNVVAGTRRAFITLLGAQKRLELTREAHRIASLLASTVHERVVAGAVSPIEETRAKVALSMAMTDVERAARDVEEARRGLAAAIGETTPSFGSASGELRDDFPVPELSLLESRVAENPDLARWGPERSRRDAALAAERTLAIPNLSLSASYRRIEEDSENAFVAGFSVPLPLFNRNQGAIREAEAAVSRASLERRSAEVKLRAQLAQRHAVMTAAAREAKALREEALSGAQSAYDAVSEGYRLGKFRYLDVLDAGKALIETKLRHVDALVSMNLARADVERLITQPLEPGKIIPAER